MTFNTASTEKTSIILPLALGAVIVFIALRSFSGPSPEMANLRYCDSGAQSMAADVSQAGKIKTQDVAATATGTISRMRVEASAADAVTTPVSYTRCLPPV